MVSIGFLPKIEFGNMLCPFFVQLFVFGYCPVKRAYTKIRDCFVARLLVAGASLFSVKRAKSGLHIERLIIRSRLLLVEA